MYIENAELTLETLLHFVTLEDRDVLEIGCGDGRITADMAGKSRRLVAVEPELESLAVAKNNIPGVAFFSSSGEALPFTDKSFDIVLFTLSLHHQDGSTALQEALRVMRDAGRLVVIEPAVDGELAIVCNLFNDETEVLNGAIDALRSSPFRQIGVETYCLNWVFEDNRDLHHYLFNFYQAAYDQRKVAEIDRLLGPKSQLKPFALQDKLIVTCLAPNVS